jgi:hypothetical protein
MTTEMKIYTRDGRSNQEIIDLELEWLTHLPQSRKDTLPEMAEIEATVSALSKPCNPVWCMARIAALLNPYYDKDTPQMVREMEAEDWLEEVGKYPQWAIERAVRWWKSAENERRRHKPLEGDISARCKVEMRGIGCIPDLIRNKIERWYRESLLPKQEPEPERVVVTPERRAQIAAELGLPVIKPKRFGADT